MTNFSVLIANYNNGKYLETAIKSVFNQTFQNFEIIIIDDASSDGSTAIYQKYKDDTRFKIEVLKTNHGCGYAKRRCVELATGSICAFLDADDALTPNALQDMVNAHSENLEASLISSHYYKCDSHLSIVRLRKIKEQCPDFLYAKDIDLHFASFKRNSYLKTIGIDPTFKRAVDQDLYLKLSEVGKLAYIPQYHYYYRIHKGGISTILNSDSDKAFQWFVLAKYNACLRRNIEFDSMVFPHPDLSIPSVNKVLRFRNILKFLYWRLCSILHIYAKYEIKDNE